MSAVASSRGGRGEGRVRRWAARRGARRRVGTAAGRVGTAQGRRRGVWAAAQRRHDGGRVGGGGRGTQIERPGEGTI
jgi:hypothetical protein